MDSSEEILLSSVSQFHAIFNLIPDNGNGNVCCCGGTLGMRDWTPQCPHIVFASKGSLVQFGYLFARDHATTESYWKSTSTAKFL